MEPPSRDFLPPAAALRSGRVKLCNMAAYSPTDFHLVSNDNTSDLMAIDPAVEVFGSPKFSHATGDYSIAGQMKHAGLLSAAYSANENAYVSAVLYVVVKHPRRHL